MQMDIPLGSLRQGDVVVDQEGDIAEFDRYSSTLYFGYFKYEGLGEMKMPISGLRIWRKADGHV